ncbi:uncharacterized protein LOC111610486 isoform X1 [Xiphophorus maculatus]|uniref:uncharacterized protein LOC111610486 isoform X1 n=2 Tax=Xiphophorus maculatus TaxID=8083 RepID=UPI000C6DD3AC|nr:uncharacterized protein LOC111610486 isoform X1 [Xiphophorus maculatus]
MLLKEPSNLPVSGVTQSRNLPKIGLNQLIIVSCQEKQQVYCRVCSVRLRTSTHSTNFTHCWNYVTMTYPGWTANLSKIGDKFKDIVAHLAEIEKSIGSQKPQRIEVKKAFYLKLAALSEREAIEELKTMERRDSSSVAGTLQMSRQEAQSPCEVSSSNDGEDCKAGNPTRDHLQTSARCNKMDPDHVPSSETKDASETVKQDPFMPAIDAQSQSLMGSSRVKVDSILPPERILSKSLSPSQDAPQAGNCRPKVKICKPQTRAEPLQIKRTGLSHKVREAPMHDRPPRGHDELPAPITCFGRKAPGCSNLILFLHARQVDIKQVIGMEFLWECRGICLDTFYLCESCEETVPNSDICLHMTSHNHQLKYMWKRHPEFLKIFWQEEDLPQSLKIYILREVIRRLVERDRFQKIDAKCVILKQKLHQFVRMAQFSEALKIVQNVLNEEEKSTVHLLCSAACQRNDEEITKSTVLEKMSNVGTSDVITKMDFSPVDLNCSSSKTDLVGSCVLNRRADLAKDAKPDLFQKPVLTSALAFPQSSGQKLLPEETSCTAVRTKLHVSVSGPLKKRSAVKTLHKTSSPSTDPLPAKRTLFMQKMKSEPTSPNSVSSPVNLPAGPSLLGIKDEDSGPKQLKSTVDQDLFSKPTSHLKRITPKLIKDNITTINSCATSAPAMPQTSWDAKIDDSGSVSYNWDSKCHLIEAPWRKNPPTNSLEGTKMVTSDLGCKNELVTIGLDSAPKIVSSFENPQRSVADNVTEDEPITALAPTADLFKLQDQQFFSVQNICRNESRLPFGCAATNPDSEQVPEPKCDPEPDRTVIGSSLFSTTGADQPDPIKHMFQCSYTEQAHPDINKKNQISFHVDPPLRPACTVAASGDCDPHVQAACGQMGNSGYPSYQAAAGQKRADASFRTESSHQPFIYSSLIYPQQMVNPFSLSPFSYHLTSQLPPGTGSFNTLYYPWPARMGM